MGFKQMTSSKTYIDCFALLSQHEHLSNLGMEEEYISEKTVQQPKCAITDQPGEMKQSGSYWKNKQELKKKTTKYLIQKLSPQQNH